MSSPSTGGSEVKRNFLRRPEVLDLLGLLRGEEVGQHSYSCQGGAGTAFLLSLAIQKLTLASQASHNNVSSLHVHPGAGSPLATSSLNEPFTAYLYRPIYKLCLSLSQNIHVSLQTSITVSRGTTPTSFPSRLHPRTLNYTPPPSPHTRPLGTHTFNSSSELIIV